MRTFEVYDPDLNPQNSVEDALAEWMPYLNDQYGPMGKDKFCNTHNKDYLGLYTDELISKMNANGIPSENAFLISLWEHDAYQLFRITYMDGNYPTFKYRVVLIFKHDADAVMFKLAIS